jgi:hypothetical protein
MQSKPQLETSIDTKEEEIVVELDCKNNGNDHEFHIRNGGQECCNLSAALAADSLNGDEDYRESASVKNDSIGESLMMTEQEMRDLCFHVDVLDNIVHSPRSTTSTSDGCSSSGEITKKIPAGSIIFSDEDFYSRRGDTNQIENSRLPLDSSLLEKAWEANSADEDDNGLPMILDEKNTSELTTTANDVDTLEGGLSRNCNDLPRNVGAAGDPSSLEDMNLPDVPTLSSHQQHLTTSSTSKIDDNNEVLHLTHALLTTTMPGDGDRDASCCDFTKRSTSSRLVDRRGSRG